MDLLSVFTQENCDICLSAPYSKNHNSVILLYQAGSCGIVSQIELVRFWFLFSKAKGTPKAFVFDPNRVQLIENSKDGNYVI